MRNRVVSSGCRYRKCSGFAHVSRSVSPTHLPDEGSPCRFGAEPILVGAGAELDDVKLVQQREGGSNNVLANGRPAERESGT